MFNMQLFTIDAEPNAKILLEVNRNSECEPEEEGTKTINPHFISHVKLFKAISHLSLFLGTAFKKKEIQGDNGAKFSVS